MMFEFEDMSQFIYTPKDEDKIDPLLVKTTDYTVKLSELPIRFAFEVHTNGYKNEWTNNLKLSLATHKKNKEDNE